MIQSRHIIKLAVPVPVPMDQYFGTLMMTFGFRDENTCGVKMVKNAEDFLSEYQGYLMAYR